MGGLKPGLYKLRLAASPSPLVGVERVDRVPQPVITRGKQNAWRVEHVEGDKYRLFIETEGGSVPLNIQSERGDIVGSTDPPQTWIIKGPEGGPYEIHLDSPIIPERVWTVNKPAIARSPVVLGVLLLPVTPENKKWYFVPPGSE